MRGAQTHNAMHAMEQNRLRSIGVDPSIHYYIKEDEQKNVSQLASGYRQVDGMDWYWYTHSVHSGCAKVILITQTHILKTLATDNKYKNETQSDTVDHFYHANEFICASDLSPRTFDSSVEQFEI